jgi:hypothetical protein
MDREERKRRREEEERERVERIRMSRQCNEEIMEKTAGTDEPVMVFRAQDKYSTDAIYGYQMALASSGVSTEFLYTVVNILHEFDAWQAANPDKVKTPDL